MNPPSSASDDDSPVPKSTRPFETRSSIEMRSAMRAGWLNAGGVCTMPCPRRMCFVRCDAAARNTSGALECSTPRGSGARPPTRSRCRAGRRTRSARARPGSAGTRSRRSTAAAAGARRRCRTSCRDLAPERGLEALRGARRGAGCPSSACSISPIACLQECVAVRRRASARVRASQSVPITSVPAIRRPDSPTNVRSRISVSAVRR